MSNEIIKGHAAIVEWAQAQLGKLPLPPGVNITLPPNSSEEMGGTYLEYEVGERLRAKFVTSDRYANALGIVQGGFITAMFDNVFGGLGLMATGQPLTTVDLVTHFLSPVRPGESVEIEARLRRGGRQLIALDADAYNERNKLIATAVTSFLVLSA